MSASVPRKELGQVTSVAAYGERRARLLDVLEGLERVDREFGDSGQANLLREASRRLRAGRFTLVVLGEFKRGKSTLVNALLDADVMPVGVTPLTSAAVTIEHGEEAAVVRFSSGREEKIALTAVADFASERGNPGNKKGVERLSIHHQASILRHGVVLVDTPGVGSIYQHNTEAVYRYMPEADAVIFVLSVDPPASESELSFLRDVRSQVSRIFFLLNKADQLTAEELDESLAFVRRALAAGADLHDVQIFPVSARYRDAGFERFEQQLEAFLTEGRGAFLLERAEERARMAIAECRMAIELEERSLDLSVDELHRRTDLLESRLEEIERKRWDAEHHLEADIRALIGEYLDPALEDLRRDGSGHVRSAIEQASTQTGVTRAKLDAVIKDKTKEFMSGRMAHLEAELGERLGQLGDRYADQTNQLADEVQQLSAELFGVSISRVEAKHRLEPPSRFTFKLEDQFMAIELVSLGMRELLPGGLGRWVAKRDALRTADEMMDRHRGRLRYDLIQRLQEQQRALRARLAETIAAAESSVRSSIARASEAHRQGSQSVAQERQQLETYREELAQLEEGLNQATAS